MRAILVNEETQALYIGYVDTPNIKENELLVRVHATALNRADLLQRRGQYPPPPGASNILGLEMAGEVVQVGNQVTNWKIGDKVFSLLSGGGYAEYVNVPAEMAMPIPESLSFESAAAIPEAFLTAYQALCFIGGLKAEHSVLIHAGASGVGTAAIQIASEMEARCFVTVGKEKKQKVCVSLGAEAAINYNNESFEAKIKQLTDGKGVDLILDCVGADYWQQNINSLALDGKLIIISAMSGGVVEKVNIYEILRRRLQIIGTTLRNRSLDYKIALTKEFAKFALPRFSDHCFVPVIDKVISWQEVEQGHKEMQENLNIGKIVLTIQ